LKKAFRNAAKKMKAALTVISTGTNATPTMPRIENPKPTF
jgi:hypothetical protein